MGSGTDEQLTDDHSELGDLLGRLINALERKDVAESHATLDLFWARLAVHIRAEHLHLFPEILRAVNRNPSQSPTEDLPSPTETQRVIEELRNDHEFFMRELSEAIIITRSLLKDAAVSGDPFKEVHDRVCAVQARLVKHNEIEEQGIYAWSRSLLSEAEQSELAARVNRELQNMPPRFDVV